MDASHAHCRGNPQTSIKDALRQLYFLGAIDGSGVVTSLGRRMAEYPLEPKLSRMLIHSRHLGVEVRMPSLFGGVDQPRCDSW